MNELEAIYLTRDEFKGSYVPYNNAIKQSLDFVLAENQPLTDADSVPVRVSILINLIGASLRIREHCLAKKYLEELFESESSYFKRDDAMDLFLNLNKAYTETILRCNPKN